MMRSLIALRLDGDEGKNKLDNNLTSSHLLNCASPLRCSLHCGTSTLDQVPSVFVPKSSFHTSTTWCGNPKSIVYDLVAEPPKNPDEWEFRYVRFGKEKKKLVRKVPMGRPQLQFIPDGHVNRAGEPYTVDPLPWHKTGGRDPETGRKVNARVGGGLKRYYRMLDNTRNVPLGEMSPFVERVLEVVDDETRSPHLALVASGNFKRYIIASENMKKGDLIKTHNEIPRNPVQALEGDAYPLGALPKGTIVHNVEQLPGEGGHYAVNAGTCCTILRKVEDRIIISIPRKGHKGGNKVQEVSVDERCMATVGRVSNVNHRLIPIGDYLTLRHLGYRPRSGLWQRKTGRFGRKIKPTPKMKVINTPPRPFAPIYQDESSV